LLISSSKSFSYAGQRVGLLVLSEALIKRNYPHLKKRFGSENFGYVLIYRLFNAFSLGASHSCQYGFAAMLKAASDGVYCFLDDVKEYERRAITAKDIFLSAGFEIVYDSDLDEKLGDGFYFTVAFPGMSGAELVERLLYYGISAVSLSETGSERQGMRVCMSQLGEDKVELLKERVRLFTQDYNK
jgi:aspartate/methionine/tyrosine aminotransferase